MFLWAAKLRVDAAAGGGFRLRSGGCRSICSGGFCFAGARKPTGELRVRPVTGGQMHGSRLLSRRAADKNGTVARTCHRDPAPDAAGAEQQWSIYRAALSASALGHPRPCMETPGPRKKKQSPEDNSQGLAQNMPKASRRNQRTSGLERSPASGRLHAANQWLELESAYPPGSGMSWSNSTAQTT